MNHLYYIIKEFFLIELVINSSFDFIGSNKNKVFYIIIFNINLPYCRIFYLIKYFNYLEFQYLLKFHLFIL
jgi:hypothetical protein